MNIKDLEAGIQRHLGFPDPGGKPAPIAIISRQSLLAMRAKLRSLRYHSEQIGKLPVGYPMPIHVIMKFISAFLPWYTRPLREFGEHTTQTLEAMALALEEIVKQDEIGKRHDAQR